MIVIVIVIAVANVDLSSLLLAPLLSLSRSPLLIQYYFNYTLLLYFYDCVIVVTMFTTIIISSIFVVTISVNFVVVKLAERPGGVRRGWGGLPQSREVLSVLYKIHKWP